MEVSAAVKEKAKELVAQGKYKNLHQAKIAATQILAAQKNVAAVKSKRFELFTTKAGRQSLLSGSSPTVDMVTKVQQKVAGIELPKRLVGGTPYYFDDEDNTLFDIDTARRIGTLNVVTNEIDYDPKYIEYYQSK